MEIQPTQSLPDTIFSVMTGEGPSQLTTKAVFNKQNVVLFAVPGAFTPTCHNTHLKDYLSAVPAFTKAGIDRVACLAVNDIFVLNAWRLASGDENKTITYLADGNGDFTKAIGMVLDLQAFRMGLRSKRYAMLVKDGEVKAVHVEPDPTKVSTSGAQAMLELVEKA